MFLKIFKIVLTFVPAIIDSIAKAKRKKRDQQNQLEIQRKNLNDGMDKMSKKLEQTVLESINKSRKDNSNGWKI